LSLQVCTEPSPAQRFSPAVQMTPAQRLFTQIFRSPHSVTTHCEVAGSHDWSLPSSVQWRSPGVQVAAAHSPSLQEVPDGHILRSQAVPEALQTETSSPAHPFWSGVQILVPPPPSAPPPATHVPVTVSQTFPPVHSALFRQVPPPPDPASAAVPGFVPSLQDRAQPASAADMTVTTMLVVFISKYYQIFSAHHKRKARAIFDLQTGAGDAT
jgi:hypothetical protein